MPLPRPTFAVLAAATLLFTGCPKDVSNEDRLERDTAGDAPMKKTMDAEELSKISCKNIDDDLGKARAENRSETDRVLSYIDLYKSLQTRSNQFEEAMSRNPDLSYREGSQELVAAKDLCIQQTADVRVEFERYIRELVEVPVVDELRGGTTVKVARVNFETVRQAIDVLSPDDKDQLLGRVANAEKKVEVSAPESTGKKRR